MVTDWSEVSAIATVIYGGATLLLVIQIWRDRVQRDRHFRAEADNRKLNELHSAFYDETQKNQAAKKEKKGKKQ